MASAWARVNSASVSERAPACVSSMPPYYRPKMPTPRGQVTAPDGTLAGCPPRWDRLRRRGRSQVGRTAAKVRARRGVEGAGVQLLGYRRSSWRKGVQLRVAGDRLYYSVNADYRWASANQSASRSTACSGVSP